MTLLAAAIDVPKGSQALEVLIPCLLFTVIVCWALWQLTAGKTARQINWWVVAPVFLLGQFFAIGAAAAVVMLVR